MEGLEGEGEGKPEAGAAESRAPATPEAPVFAVRTTRGHEREAAGAIAQRAAKERVDVRSAAAGPEGSGFVLVEAQDFDRVTNLVASVRHARGVLAPRAGGNVRGAAVPRAVYEEVLGGAGPESAEALLERMAGAEGEEGEARAGRGAAPPPEDHEQEPAAEGPPARAAKRRRETPSGPVRGDSARREPKGEQAGRPEAKPRAERPGELPALSPRAARLVNLAIGVPVAVLAVGLLTAPKIFWDGFLYPYFWRSIACDATNVGGACEAYNPVDTLTYALLLIPAVLLIYRVLERLKVKLDTRFVLMLTPFLILGGAARALEDASRVTQAQFPYPACLNLDPAVYGPDACSGYYAPSLAPVFISPIIYVAEGLFVLGLVVASWWVVREVRERGRFRGLLAWTAAFAPGALALYYAEAVDTRLVAAPVPLPILMSLLACGYLAGLVLVNRARAPEVHGFVSMAGVLLLGLTAYLIARWIVLGAWNPSPATPAATRAGEAPVIIGLAASATLLSLTGLYLASMRYKALAGVLTPINVLVLFGQFLDGSATYWGIDHFGYEEKHVLAGSLIAATGTAAVMFPLKLGFVLLVLYLTDVLFRKDLYDEEGEMSSFAGLLKLTVTALGMGPGTRDMLRLAMGV